MILPVSDLTSIKPHSYFLQRGNSANDIKKFPTNKIQISFKGALYGNKYYTDQEIADARKYLHASDENLPELYFDIYDRKGFFNYLFSAKEVKNHVKQVQSLMPHLRREEQLRDNEARQSELAATRRRLARETAKAEEANKKALAKTEYINKLNEKQNQLKADFCDKVNMEKQGLHIEKMPNVIMIEDPYDDVSKELVDYVKRNTESKFIRLESSDNDTLMDNLEETLKKSKAHFNSTKERTLINVEGFDRLITRGQNSFENVDSLKDIMCRCAKDFGSTIIFRTKDASKLVSEAIQPHRVAVKILTNFKSVR